MECSYKKNNDIFSTITHSFWNQVDDCDRLEDIEVEKLLNLIETGKLYKIFKNDLIKVIKDEIEMDEEEMKSLVDNGEADDEEYKIYQKRVLLYSKMLNELV